MLLQPIVLSLYFLLMRILRGVVVSARKRRQKFLGGGEVYTIARRQIYCTANSIKSLIFTFKPLF